MQSFELWCDICVKTIYHDNEETYDYEHFIFGNIYVACKDCAKTQLSDQSKTDKFLL